MNQEKKELTPRQRKQDAIFKTIRNALRDDLKRLSDEEIDNLLLFTTGAEINILELVQGEIQAKTNSEPSFVPATT